MIAQIKCGELVAVGQASVPIVVVGKRETLVVAVEMLRVGRTIVLTTKLTRESEVHRQRPLGGCGDVGTVGARIEEARRIENITADIKCLGDVIAEFHITFIEGRNGREHAIRGRGLQSRVDVGDCTDIR